MRRHGFKALGTLAVGLAAAGAAGCAGNDTSHKDSPTGRVDRSRAEVAAMPNDFGNVANKCDGHGHRIFVTTNTDSNPSQLVVLNDPTCPKE